MSTEINFSATVGALECPCCKGKFGIFVYVHSSTFTIPTPEPIAREIHGTIEQAAGRTRAFAMETATKFLGEIGLSMRDAAKIVISDGDPPRQEIDQWRPSSNTTVH